MVLIIIGHNWSSFRPAHPLASLVRASPTVKEATCPWPLQPVLLSKPLVIKARTIERSPIDSAASAAARASRLPTSPLRCVEVFEKDARPLVGGGLLVQQEHIPA